MRRREIEANQALVQSMTEALRVIPQYIAAADKDNLYELLNACQQSAIGVGESIEKTQNNPNTVHILERFCDELYYLWENPDQNQHLVNLEQMLAQVETDLREKITETYEIVFLPYNASMWDCMESVYYAATADERCQVYVIPIPFYEIKDGQPVLRYEADRMPPEIPITDYRAYDIAVRQPDIGYIHNPFDDTNYVTQVHSNYYSFNLKKYISTLVYIPYFTAGADFPAMHWQLSAYRYVDYIILQTTNQIRKIANYVPRHKLLALGSPKYDKIDYWRQSPELIPRQWQQQMAEKKIVLYSVSVGTLLEYQDKALDKIEYVLEQLLDHPNICVLWRPHPLYEATIESMLPQLSRRYQQIKQRFAEHQQGIFDQTGDVSRSSVIADAYVGDSSSVVKLFELQGKPVLLTNPGILRPPNQDDLSFIYTSRVLVEPDKIWFVASYTQELCYLDRGTKKTVVVAQLPERGLYGNYGYWDLCRVEDKIYIAPYSALNIVIYDIHSKTIETIALDDTPFKFGKIIPYQKQLYFMPVLYRGILKLDLATHQLSIIDEYKRLLEGMTDLRPYFHFGYCRRGEKLFMASSQANQVVVMDLLTEATEVYEVGGPSTSFYSIADDGKHFWLGSYTGSTIIRWDYDKGLWEEYSRFPKQYVNKEGIIVGFGFVDQYVYAYPLKGNGILRIHKTNGNIELIKDVLQENGENRSCQYLYEYQYDYIQTAQLAEDEYQVVSTKNMSVNLIRKDSVTTYPLQYKKPLVIEYDTKDRKTTNWLLFYNQLEGRIDTIESFAQDLFDQQKMDRLGKEKSAHCTTMDSAVAIGQSGTAIHQQILVETIMRAVDDRVTGGRR